MYFDHTHSCFTQSHLLPGKLLLAHDFREKFHHGGPGTASRVAVCAAIMVVQAGKVGWACPQSSLLD